VDTMCDSVEECSGKSLVHQYLGPLLEGQVGGHDDALTSVGAAYDFEACSPVHRGCQPGR
jgi:hypothetical protein